MSNEIHEQLADALVSVIEGIWEVKKVYKWSPGVIKAPAAVVELPTIRRTEPDKAEDHLGASDWWLDFPVLLYVELLADKHAQKTQATVAQLAVDFISAIDNLQPDGDGFVLNGLSEDAKVTSAEPFATPSPDEAGRHTLGYETHVSILTFQ
jgi:hypothetical protein